MRQDFPLLEYDSAPGVIEPARVIAAIDAPVHCVLCFFREVIEHVVAEHAGRILFTITTEMGAHPLYEINVQGRRLAVAHPGVGAPLAAGMFEEMIALGCRKFIACGGAGVLRPDIAVGHVVVPVAAVRDEGTSYHYLPPAREVAADTAGVAAVEATLAAHAVPYVLGKTWTTDAFYRETPGKVAQRRSEGCLTVEMEAAAFFAVARFRGVPFGQLLYGGDDVSGDEWDHRGWQRHNVRESLFWLAAEACLALA